MGSYSSADLKSVYSTALADWAKFQEEFNKFNSEFSFS